MVYDARDSLALAGIEQRATHPRSRSRDQS